MFYLAHLPFLPPSASPLTPAVAASFTQRSSLRWLGWGQTLDPMKRQLIDQLSNHLLAVGAVTRVCYCKSPSSVWHQQMLKRYLLNGLMKFLLLSSLCLLDPTSSSQAYCSETKRLMSLTTLKTLWWLVPIAQSPKPPISPSEVDPNLPCRLISPKLSPTVLKHHLLRSHSLPLFTLCSFHWDHSPATFSVRLEIAHPSNPSSPTPPRYCLLLPEMLTAPLSSHA